MGDLLGRVVGRGRFEVVRQIGEGGQGRTFLARDRLAGGRDVVVKELVLGRVENWKSVELFEREAQALRSMQHALVPAYIDAFVGEEDGRFYLVQEFVQGEDLQSRIDAGDLMDEERALNFLEQMLGILAYLHSLSPPVIHRDLKPSNIMVGHDGWHRLIDFGAVQSVIPDRVGGSTIVGTTGYMAPEQLLGRATPSSDLYSLAATVVHAVVGIQPANLPVVRLRLNFRRLANLSDGLSDILERMLAPEMGERFQRAEDVLLALAALRDKKALEPQNRLIAEPGVSGGQAWRSTEWEAPPLERPVVERPVLERRTDEEELPGKEVSAQLMRLLDEKPRHSDLVQANIDERGRLEVEISSQASVDWLQEGWRKLSISVVVLLVVSLGMRDLALTGALGIFLGGLLWWTWWNIEARSVRDVLRVGWDRVQILKYRLDGTLIWDKSLEQEEIKQVYVAPAGWHELSRPHGGTLKSGARQYARGMVWITLDDQRYLFGNEAFTWTQKRGGKVLSQEEVAWMERLIQTYQAEMVEGVLGEEVNEVAIAQWDAGGVHPDGVGALEKQRRDVEVAVRE